ncbi:MAG: peptidoglycan-associated lipoprotein Pal [Alphaproteobacteria bacterium]|nr:peptidoglycan-associated lipoprotein Pal [Alphaproteobacteria bacterium]
MIILLSLFVTACTGNDAIDEGVVVTSDREGISTGVDGTGYDVSGTALPGSSEDLVENVGDRIFFGYDSYNLSGEARAVLERQAQWLSQYQNLSVTIEGHADERGTREYNLALGERHANAVQSYLAALGVDASRLSVVSYGKERPVVFDNDPSAWAQNRRGVTTIN